MTREIKFRGYSEELEKWCFGSLVDYGEERMEIHGFDVFRQGDDSWHEIPVIPETVGQYTGLEDRNGKEIYEGDIVKWENLMKTPMRSVIRYIYNGFKFTDFDGEDQEIWCGVFEIIGNIHDNPELAKGGEK